MVIAPQLGFQTSPPDTVGLVWTDPNNTETGYEIQRSAGGASFFSLFTTGKNVTTWIDSSPPTDITLAYRVRARGKRNTTSVWSNVVSTIITRSQVPIQDTAIHYVPYPAPTLPAAGGSLVDPTFGTRIYRVTDASSAPSGVKNFSDCADSQWNCTGTMFLLYINGSGWHLYSFNRTTFAITDEGLLNSTPIYDGAAWHPIEPGTLYASDTGRIVYKLTGLPTNPGQTPTVVHDFTSQIPVGGFSSSRVGISNTGQYIMMFGSSQSGQGQDFYDYVSIWDVKNSTSVITSHVPDHYGAGQYLHSADMIPGDTYVRFSFPDQNSAIWNWKDDTYSTVVLNTTDNFAAHKTFTTNAIYNPAVGTGGPGSTTWLHRDAASPHTFSTLFTYPLRSSLQTYLWDAHGSNVLPSGGFTEDPQTWGDVNSLTWVLHSGAVWKVIAFSTTPNAGYATTFGPDVFLVNDQPLTLVTAIPTGSGQFYYDSGADVLYVRLADDSNPNSVTWMLITPQTPCMDEIVYNTPAWITHRYCHHRAFHNPGDFYTDPLAHPDPTGRFVLFTSNWSVHAGRIDAFIVDGQGR